MLTAETPKTRRMNVLMTEDLVECLSITAQSRGMTVSAFVRHAVERECQRSREDSIAAAAEALAPLYESDKELTAFSALDGEDFA